MMMFDEEKEMKCLPKLILTFIKIHEYQLTSNSQKRMKKKKTYSLNPSTFEPMPLRNSASELSLLQMHFSAI